MPGMRQALPGEQTEEWVSPVGCRRRVGEVGSPGSQRCQGQGLASCHHLPRALMISCSAEPGAGAGPWRDEGSWPGSALVPSGKLCAHSPSVSQQRSLPECKRLCGAARGPGWGSRHPLLVRVSSFRDEPPSQDAPSFQRHQPSLPDRIHAGGRAEHVLGASCLGCGVQGWEMTSASSLAGATPCSWGLCHLPRVSLSLGKGPGTQGEERGGVHPGQGV